MAKLPENQRPRENLKSDREKRQLTLKEATIILTGDFPSQVIITQKTVE